MKQNQLSGETTFMVTALSMLNTLLTRSGQLPASSLQNLQAPAKQALQALNDTLIHMNTGLNAPWLYQKTSLTTQINNAIISLPQEINLDLIVSNSLFNAITNQALMMTSPQAMQRNFSLPSTLGAPCLYWFENNQLKVYPTPNAVYTITLLYKTIPTAFTLDSSSLDWPNNWVHVLTLGAQARLEKFLEDNRFADTQQSYLQGLATLQAQASKNRVPRIQGAYRGYPSV
jgi:hypothetical protein